MAKSARSLAHSEEENPYTPGHIWRPHILPRPGDPTPFQQQGRGPKLSPVEQPPAETPAILPPQPPRFSRDDLKALEGEGQGDGQPAGQLSVVPAPAAPPKPVYDEPSGVAPSKAKPDLKVIKGDEEASGPKASRLRESEAEPAKAPKKASREQLSNAEESAAPAVRHEHQIGPGFRKVAPSKSRLSLRGRFKKRWIAFATALAAVISAIIIFTLFTGPLQFIHLAQILERNFFHTEQTVKFRNKGLLRYYRTGAAEETRLGKVGSVVYNRALAQMHDQGIDFQRNSRGVPDTMTIDTAQNDDYKGLSPEDAKSAIIDDYKITDPNIIKPVAGKPGVFSIDLNATSLKGIDFVKATARTAIGSLGNGKIETALGFRYLKQAWDLPNLFSPLDKAKAAINNKFATPSAAKQAEDQAEQERLATEETAVTSTPEVTDARGKLSDALKSDTGKAIARIALGQMLLCAVRNSADAAVTLNRALIVLPVVIQATDKISIGSQVQSGQNFDETQLGAVADSFTDSSGKSIWQGKALQVLEGEAAPGGPDLPAQFGQAFSGDTTADSIKKAIQIHFPYTKWNITNFACSSLGQYTIAAANVLQLAAGFFDEGATWQTLASEVTTQLAYSVATAGIMSVLQHYFTNVIEQKVIAPAVLSGPLGGNLLAYGAREMGNIGARSLGGVALSGTNSTTMTVADQKAYDQQFASEPLADRLFNVDDSRSAVSKFIDNVNPNPQNLATSLGSMFTNFGSMFTHVFSVLSPRAMAAATPYNWGFPLYGIPDSIAEAPQYQDPYANADDIAAMLDQQHCDTNNKCELRTDAMTCFGVDINKDSGVWSVVAKGDTNPDTTDYTSDCNQNTDEFHRLMLFVMDSRIMDATACQQGVDEQSCANLDEEGTTSSSSTSTNINSSGSGTLPSGTAQQLAQQILNNKNIHLIGRLVLQDIQDTIAGKAASAGNPLSQTLLSLIAYMGQTHTFNITALESGGTGHSGPGDPHYEGDAVDITGLDGDPIANSGIGRTPNDQKLISQIAPMMPSSTGNDFYHWSGFGQDECGTTPPLPSGIMSFDDTCSHLHIQVPVGTP